MAEQTIDRLSVEINAKAKGSVSGIEKLTESIQKLRDVTRGGTGGLSGIAASFEKLNKVITDLKGKSGTISSIVNSFKKLNEIDTGKIGGKINSLKTSLGSLTTLSPEIKTLVNNLGSISKTSTGSVAQNAMKIQASIAKSKATIDKSTLASAKAQFGLDAIAEKNRKIKESANFAAEAQESLNDAIKRCISSSSNPIDSTVKLPTSAPRYPSATASEIRNGTLGLQEAINSFSGNAAKNINEVSNSSSKAAGFVNRLRNAFNSAKKSTDNFGNSARVAFRLQNFYGLYFVFRRIASAIGGSIHKINSYVENMNLFTVAMGKSADEGKRLAFNLQKVLGIDAGEAMRYMGLFKQITTSFGVVSKQSTVMSENLTQLGYDIASYFNISTEKSFEKLQSGLAGQTRALREIGIDISQARLQQELYNLGIREKVSNLSQADKAELRYIAIMKQSTNAQGDMARTIQTPANALRILRAQFQITSRAIGSAFIPALQAILPPITAVIQIIGELASELAAFLGFELPKIDYSKMDTGVSGIADNAEKASTGIGNIGKNAKESKKEMDNLIGGFDELNVINKDSSGSSLNSGGSGVGTGGNILGDIDLPKYDALSGAVKNNIDAIRKSLEKYKPLMKEILKSALEIGATFLAWKISSGLSRGLIKLFPTLKNFKAQFAEISAGLALVAGLFTFAYLHSENFRRGLDKVGEGFNWVGKKINEFSSNVAKDLGIKELSGEFWTSTAAIVVIAIGAVAVALGAPIFGTIAIVGGAAVLAIQAIGYAASDSIEPVNLFGDGISETTEKKVKPFIKAMDELDQTIKTIKWSGKIITDADVESVRQQVKRISDTIINELDADRNQSLQTLSPLKNLLKPEMYDSIIAASGRYYDKQKLTVKQGEDQINHIMKTASDQKRGLTDSEYKEISKIQENMKTTGIKHLSESETESNLIFQRLKDNHTALSAQEASEIVKNSVKTRDKTISDAKKQYEGICTEAQRMYDTGEINKTQYDEIIKAAGKSKDDTIKHAKEQHTNILKEAKKQSGDLSKQIDWSTGDIKSKWQVFWEDTNKKFSDGWNSINNYFKKSLPDWWNKTIAPWFTAKKWTDMMNGVKVGFQTTFKNAINGAIELFNQFIGWVNSKMHFEWDSLKIAGKTIVPGGEIQLFRIPSIPKLAKGGILNKPTNIIAGEAGPEAVVPLSENSDWIEKVSASVSTKINTPEKDDSKTDEILRAMFIVADKVVEAIENKDTSVSLDGEKITQNVNRRNSNRGYSLGLSSN